VGVGSVREKGGAVTIGGRDSSAKIAAEKILALQVEVAVSCLLSYPRPAKDSQTVESLHMNFVGF